MGECQSHPDPDTDAESGSESDDGPWIVVSTGGGLQDVLVRERVLRGFSSLYLIWQKGVLQGIGIEKKFRSVHRNI